jgi:hypothetical protein
LPARWCCSGSVDSGRAGRPRARLESGAPLGESPRISMVTELRTGRGIYRLSAAAPLENDHDVSILTLALERADGIERVVFRCRVVRQRLDNAAESELLIVRMTPWIERDFEQIREAALKSIRTEGRLLELTFHADQPGPLRC